MILAILCGAFGIIFWGVIFSLLYKGLDRKLVARMQDRYGPPVIQPFRDIEKLMLKQTIIPKNAIPWIFNGAAIFALASALALFVFIPFFYLGSLSGADCSVNPQLCTFSIFPGDLILVWYLMLMPSLAMVIGGFASGSPYATIGAQREMVLMASYEMPLAIASVAIAYVLKTFSLDAIFLTPVWGVSGVFGLIGFAILFLVMIFVIAPELSKVPYDAPEAETELAGGVLAEYSGRNLGFFYIADAVKAFALCSLIIAMFFPYGINFLVESPSLGLILDMLFFFLKVFLLMLFSLFFVRAAFARLRIEQASRLFLVHVLSISLLGLFLVVLDTIIHIDPMPILASLGVIL
ncbi:NADH-quinone oxidoreductase subunit H [archaeon]|nr:NADH-quinone oxidoreductase subunit H [archaeon]